MSSDTLGLIYAITPDIKSFWTNIHDKKRQEDDEEEDKEEAKEEEETEARVEESEEA